MSTSGSFAVSIPTPVSVANGGTGGATLPSGAVIIGNGISAVNSVAPGANGNVLVVAAGVWASAPPAAAGAPANGTYIVQVPNGSLPNAQALSALATGLLKSTTATGVLTIATGADLPAHSAALITSGTLALARGGTNADLSLTGGANQYLKQTSVGGTLTVAGILSADLTTALTTPPAIGGTTPAAFTGTTGIFNTSIKSPLHIPSADSTTAIIFTKADGSTAVVTIDTTNNRLGVGVTPTATFHGLISHTNVSSSTTMLTFAHNISIGTPAIGLGMNINFVAQTTGSGAAANTPMGIIDVTWADPSHPTRAGAIVLKAYYGATAIRIITLTGDNTFFGKLGFFDSTGHTKYQYVNYGAASLSSAFTGTALDATAAKLADLNTVRSNYQLLRSQVLDLQTMVVGYNLMGDTS